MNKYAAEKIAQEYYNLGTALSLHKIAAASRLPRSLVGTVGQDLITAIALGNPGGLEAYVLDNIINANRNIIKLTDILKSKK